MRSHQPGKVRRLLVINGLGATGPTSASTRKGNDLRLNWSQRREIALRAAILELPVPRVEVRVEQALDELSDLIFSRQYADFVRLNLLRHRLECDLGLRLLPSEPGMELARCCYLILHDAQQLLRRHPALARWHPLEHAAMEIG